MAFNIGFLVNKKENEEQWLNEGNEWRKIWVVVGECEYVLNDSLIEKIFS